MPRLRKLIIAFIVLIALPVQTAIAQESDSERLGMAIEYFQSRKYHEALLILQKLDAKYRLNPRFQAYIGVCYYYEWDYLRATAYLDSVIPKLRSFAPLERSFYCFAAAESHFELGQYDKAMPLYEEMVTLCKDNEKPDAYYRMGFISMFREEWVAALDNFQTALVYYQNHRSDETARVAQLKTMIRGCCQKIDNQH